MEQKYQSQFGSFISKYNLGGIILNPQQASTTQSVQLQRMEQIHKSRVARAHFFTQEKSKQLEQRLEAMTQEEREKIETIQDEDMVTWYNRTKTSKKDANMKTIPGCFYKVRAQGSATSHDCNELNKFYKRSLVSCGLVMAHSYAFVQFAYQSRIISKTSSPKLIFEYTPFVVYPMALVALAVFMVVENKRVLTRLDSKYTPIWVRLTEQQALI